MNKKRRKRVISSFYIFLTVGAVIKIIEATIGFKYHPMNPPETALLIPDMIQFVLGPYAALTFPTDQFHIVYFVVSSVLPLVCFFNMFHRSLKIQIPLFLFGAVFWIISGFLLLIAHFGG